MREANKTYSWIFPSVLCLVLHSLIIQPSHCAPDNKTLSDVADKHLIDDIIHEIDAHKNKTHGHPDHHHTTTTTTTTTTAPPTASPTPAPCTCGTGARPNIAITRFLEFDEVDRSELEAHVGQSERADLEKVNGEDDRIVHGVTSNNHAWPWMASIQYTNSSGNPNSIPTNNHLCGGTLINSQYILTAAHCFSIFQNPSPKDFSVILGSNAITSKVSDRIVVKVSQITTHPKFNKATLENDVTLLKLASPVTFSNNTRPICLSQAGSPFPNRKVIVAGWGSTNINGSNPAAYLREAGMRTISNSKCSTDSNSTISSSKICAIGSLPATNAGTCRGDSGGPLMLYRPKTKSYSQIGIVSYGIRQLCGGTGIPDVFTRVGSFTNFIKYVTNGTSFCTHSF